MFPEVFGIRDKTQNYLLAYGRQQNEINELDKPPCHSECEANPSQAGTEAPSSSHKGAINNGHEIDREAYRKELQDEINGLDKPCHACQAENEAPSSSFENAMDKVKATTEILGPVESATDVMKEMSQNGKTPAFRNSAAWEEWIAKNKPLGKTLRVAGIVGHVMDVYELNLLRIQDQRDPIPGRSRFAEAIVRITASAVLAAKGAEAGGEVCGWPCAIGGGVVGGFLGALTADVQLAHQKGQATEAAIKIGASWGGAIAGSIYGLRVCGPWCGLAGSVIGGLGADKLATKAIEGWKNNTNAGTGASWGAYAGGSVGLAVCGPVCGQVGSAIGGLVTDKLATNAIEAWKNNTNAVASRGGAYAGGTIGSVVCGPVCGQVGSAIGGLGADKLATKIEVWKNNTNAGKESCTSCQKR
ncbi:hypothetical protein Ddc_15223 [Ditylenchus destructor]|nr:hypothetical protein Ddc_15223 [Ditylenchus destructor]